MGLSDEERRSGMYFAIRELAQLGHDWEKDLRVVKYDLDKYAIVRRLVGQLWHAFLGKQSNGLHWIMGSSSSGSITHDPATPWETAIVSHLERAIQEKPEWRKEAEENPPFNAVEFEGIAHLVSCERMYGVPASYAFRIYQWTEQLIYYLRRYNDEFLQNFEEVSRISSQIFGECFAIFSQNDAFAKAYLIHQMMEIMYGQSYPYNKDIVATILDEQNLHHDFSDLMNWSVTDLTKHHIELVQVETEAHKKAEKNKEPHLWGKNPKLARLRLLKALELSKHTGEYEHVRKNIIKQLAGTEFADLIPEVEAIFVKVTERVQQQKQKDTDRFSEDSHKSALSAYGYRGYDLMRDDIEVAEEENPKPKKNKKKN